MVWTRLSTELQFSELLKKSSVKPQLIFKHSTRCNISSMVLNRLERVTAPDNIDFYFLDLLAHRDISNKISKDLSVYHESPQVLLVKNGECIYDESHNGINMPEIIEQAQSN